MSDLLDEVLAAYGGRAAWERASQITARQFFGGALWALKGHPGALDDVQVTVNLHREHTRQEPFFADGHHTDFTPDRIAVEDDNGAVVEELLDPRASFAGHDFATPWTRLQLAYFSGYAMWTYVTEPISLTFPGVRADEIGGWIEDGRDFRRLVITYPDDIATHSSRQTLYIGDDGLIHRRDYTVDIAGKTPAAEYTSSFVEVSGLTIPTTRMIYPHDENGARVPEPLVVSIHLTDIKVS
ncbi:hypothetical protein M1L60_43965 [Actinoplanes sp. TRM 88003]|uniref:Uncharacterized protein n=1 Tax=Paractinoplanes aksuensis TaxID=2939490 RepID=A0ABT1E3X4_9ACTN|nr:hypothetical protein [Actinoplanes aksuensis]MCO8277558.1 hypothetical protein [Actinoplanes aksuensis]